MYEYIRISSNRVSEMGIMAHRKGIVTPVLRFHSPSAEVIRRLHGLCELLAQDVRSVRVEAIKELLISWLGLGLWSNFRVKSI